MSFKFIVTAQLRGGVTHLEMRKLRIREYLLAKHGFKMSSNFKAFAFSISWTRSEFPWIFRVGGIYREISSM